MNTRNMALSGLVAVIVLLIAYLGVKLLIPATNFADVKLNDELDSLHRLESDPEYAITISPPSGKAESLIGYVGVIAVKEKEDDKSGKTSWRFMGDYRPSRDEIDVVPAEEKLYEGIITSGVSAGGEFTSFASTLSVDEAAQVLITNNLVLGYKDNTKIPWDRLRRIPMEAGKEYWFIDGAVSTLTTYRKYRKVKAKSTINGVAFSANGEIYASAEGFLTRRGLSLRMFDLRSLRPSQGGGPAAEIGDLLRNKELSGGDAKRLLKLLHQSAPTKAPRNIPASPESARRGDLPGFERIVSQIRIEHVPILRQEKTNSCWATAAAMLYGWKTSQRIAPDAFLRSASPRWLGVYEKDDGISIDEAREFVESSGLSFEYGQSYLPEAIETMLRRFGPLWFTVGTQRGYNTHANVVVAVFKTRDKVFLSYIDPAIGTELDEEYGSFMRRYEEPAFLYNELYMKEMVAGQIIPMHVVHY
jgi:hypothetical protein